MESAKKMVIVSTDALQRMQTQQNQPQQQQSHTKAHDTVSELDREMMRLLNDKSLNDQDKWHQYQQVLQRYLYFSAEKRKPIQLPIVDLTDGRNVKSSGLSIDDIVDTFPKTYKQDAKSLLKVLEKRKDLIDWDSDGILHIHGERVPNSNVIDVLHDVIRARKSIQPVGWHQFMHTLKQINVPHEFITNPLSREFLARIKDNPSDDLDRNVSLGIIKQIQSKTPESTSPSYKSRLDALYGAPYRTATPKKEASNTSAVADWLATTSSAVPTITATPTSRLGIKRRRQKWESFKL